MLGQNAKLAESCSLQVIDFNNSEYGSTHVDDYWALTLSLSGHALILAALYLARLGTKAKIDLNYSPLEGRRTQRTFAHCILSCRKRAMSAGESALFALFFLGQIRRLEFVPARAHWMLPSAMGSRLSLNGNQAGVSCRRA